MNNGKPAKWRVIPKIRFNERIPQMRVGILSLYIENSFCGKSMGLWERGVKDAS